MVVWLSWNDPTKLGRLFSSEFQWINYWIIPQKTGRHPSKGSRFYGEPDFLGWNDSYILRKEFTGSCLWTFTDSKQFLGRNQEMQCFVWSTFIEPPFESFWANNPNLRTRDSPGGNGSHTLHKSQQSWICLGPWNPTSSPLHNDSPGKSGSSGSSESINHPFWVGRFDSLTSEASILRMARTSKSAEKNTWAVKPRGRLFTRGFIYPVYCKANNKKPIF